MSCLRLSINPMVRKRPRLPLTRELSAKLTEGEKKFQLLPYIVDIQNFRALSPSHGLRRASPLPEGAFPFRTFFDTLKQDIYRCPAYAQ